MISPYILSSRGIQGFAMIKKKKRLFYDALSSGRVREFKSGLAFAFGGSGAVRRKAKDVRLSRELFLMALLLVVVFAATSYYVGTLRGKNGERHASLSLRSRSENAAAVPTEPVPPSEETFYAVQVTTLIWGTDTKFKVTEPQAEKEAYSLCDFLGDKGLLDVLPVKDPARKRIYVYAGRSSQPDDLDDVLERVKKYDYAGRKKAFADAKRTKVSVELP